MIRENELAAQVVDAAYHVHVELGPGLLESVYEVVLAHELASRGYKVARQVPITIRYKGLTFDEGFRADLIVEDLLLVELKSVEELHRSHKKQVLTYIKLSQKKLGLLINFGEDRIKDGIHRLVNGLPEDTEVRS